MYQSLYFMSKSTGTFADVLATYGLAKVLDGILWQALGPEARYRIWLQDAGPYYVVQLDPSMKSEWVENCPYFPGPAPYVTTGKTGQAPTDTIKRDVDKTWEEFNVYKETRKQLQTKSGMTEDLRRQLEDIEPPSDWAVVTLLGDGKMQALNTYNQIVCQWTALKHYFVSNLKTILRMCAMPYADMESVAIDWRRKVSFSKIKGRLKLKDNVSTLQLLNPHQGEGLNQPKANRLPRKNPKLKSFWLLEYLKACGLWICVAPRRVAGSPDPRRSDRKVYVLAPRRIALDTHETVFEKFSTRLWNETAIKMDCIAALLYADALLEYSEAGQFDELASAGYCPERVVAGFHIAQYKLLNPRAFTATNLAFIELPNWSGEVNSPEQVPALRKVIVEHRDVINNIDETHSDGYNLLLHYREFLSGGKWADFFEFTAGYSNYIMSQLTQGRRYMALFTTPNLRRLIMATNKPLSEIIENPGFLNVAYAIRHSTVIPQGRKAKDQQTLYEVRYGLGMDMKRKSTVRDDFVTELADFMQSYNQENNRVLEKSKQQMRRDIRTSDVQEVVKLIDEYGAEVVANLLVAYGYAREERESADSAVETNTQE